MGSTLSGNVNLCLATGDKTELQKKKTAHAHLQQMR